ncbi:MAG: 30S ribosomal protein S17e [Nitrososphaerota archaeon]|nr:30S ribosomal protein S17e [Nitrososphaerota archaeon]
MRRKLKLRPFSIESCSYAFKRWRKTVYIGGINIGKVKTEQIKHLGKELMTRFPSKFTANFEENKRLVDALTKGTTTRVRNKVAGYITRTNALAQAGSDDDSDLEDAEIAE